LRIGRSQPGGGCGKTCDSPGDESGLPPIYVPGREHVTDAPSRRFNGLSFPRSGSRVRHHQRAKIKNQVLGKDPVELEFKRGEIRFAAYTKTPGVHQIINVEKENAMRLLAVGIVYPERCIDPTWKI
jgi:hypothetical protein